MTIEPSTSGHYPFDDPDFVESYLEARSYSSKVQVLSDLVIPDRLWRKAAAREWHAVTFHLHLSEVIRAYYTGGLNRKAIDEMIEVAERSDDVALLAKGMACRVCYDDPNYLGDAADQLLARAVALLETGRGSALHRSSAYVMCGIAHQRRQLWPLVGEMNRRAFQELVVQLPEAFDEMFQWTRIATTVNQYTAHACIACEAFETGDREGAVHEYNQAPEITPDIDSLLLTRVSHEVKSLRGLLAALAGKNPPADTPSMETILAVSSTPSTPETIGVTLLAEAIRHIDAGRREDAADLALEASSHLEMQVDNLYTLSLAIAATKPPVSELALRYGRTLAAQRRERRDRSVQDANARRAAEEVLLAGRELETKVKTDALTGITNRRGLDEFRSASLTNPSHPSLGVMLVDVDNFKRVNDTHGHMVGDDVLVRIAEVLSGVARRGDLVGRLGGDEFIVVLVGVDVAVTRARADVIRRRVSSLDWEKISTGLQVEVSVGYATGPSELIDDLIIEADHRMYDDKDSKGSRVRWGAASRPG